MASPSAPLSHSRENPFRVALVSMPWAIFNRPSIQLGALKGFLQQEADWIKMDAFHPYLEIAANLETDIYHWISQDLWCSEAMYGALLFPEKRKDINRLIAQRVRLRGKGLAASFSPHAVQRLLQENLERFCEKLTSQRYDLVGFTVCFHQLLSSLSAARRIKKDTPSIPIVFGGSSCAGKMGTSLPDTFSQVDFVITGEGELPLLELCKSLSARQYDSLQKPRSEKQNYQGLKVVEKQIASLETLPIPDYTDYFSEQKTTFSQKPFIPQIPVEFSRGCWWAKCTFCNLNLQWCRYRKKNPPHMIKEVTFLSQKLASLDFVFADNSLPKQESISFFTTLARQGIDFIFFGEVKASMQRKDRLDLYSKYRAGGLTTIQIGIESLSSSLLVKMNKGASVIENITAMRDALEQKITLEGNIITEFPGSTPQEVEETLTNLEFVLPFYPLTNAAFFLGYGSPIWENPNSYDIRFIKHHPANTKIFPKQVLNNLTLPIMSYTGDRLRQKQLWKPVASKMKQWRDFHRKRNNSIFDLPPLSYRDGGSYIIVRQEKANQATLYHRLHKLSKDVYLFCRVARKLSEIQNHFGDINKKHLLVFLNDLVAKRIMFTDGNEYLSLAVRRKD